MTLWSMLFNYYFAWLLAALLLGLLLLPVVLFVATTWKTKRQDVCSFFSDPNVVQRYFEQFFRLKIRDRGEAAGVFEQSFNRRFGRRHYLLPLLFLTAISAVEVFLVSSTVSIWLGLEPKWTAALPPIAVAAIAGGYMWVLGDLTGRNNRSDISPMTLYWGSFRLVIVVPFAYALAQLLAENAGVPVAFLIGVFPTQTLRRIASRLAVRQIGVGEIGEAGITELEKLQSITTTNAERYADEGVTTILQLAYADPVDLTIRTNFSFNYVVDCVSQALAWIYFEKQLEEMRKYSLRGAQEILNLITELDGGSRAEQTRARHVVNDLAGKFGVEAAAFEHCLREVASDPYTLFLYDVWQ